ncbi:Na+/H+ antiporter subunit E [Alkalihalobacillus sp. FSL W8-0930]
MAIQIVLNLIAAIAWMLFQNSFTFVDFVIGYIIGIVALFLARPLLGYTFYMRRVVAAIKLFLLFLKELVVANIDVLKVVLSPKLNVSSSIIAVPTQLETKGEITLLAVLITLTPGTLSMDFSDDSQTIYIHALDAPDREQFIKDIQQTFERAIMEVTR